MRSSWPATLALSTALLGCHASAHGPAVAPASVTIAPTGEGQAHEPLDDSPPESACTSVLMSLASALSRTPCGVTGVIGVHWGTRATRAAARLGVTCAQWRTSFVSSEFEECTAEQPVDAFGARASVTLVRSRERLAGVRLQFARARWQDLREAARGELLLSDESAMSEAPYTSFANDSLVRVEPERGGEGVTVVVTDPAFGKAYASFLLGQGLRGLFVVH